MLVGPIALRCFALERRRIVEAFERSDLASDDSIEIGTDRARGALFEAVTNLAQGCIAFAFLRIRLGEKREDLTAWSWHTTWLGRAFRRLHRFDSRCCGDDFRQWRRVVGLRAQEKERVGPLLGIGESGKGHRRARGKGLR